MRTGRRPGADEREMCVVSAGRDYSLMSFQSFL
jgi:hypothetical protein